MFSPIKTAIADSMEGLRRGVARLETHWALVMDREQRLP